MHVHMWSRLFHPNSMALLWMCSSTEFTRPSLLAIYQYQPTKPPLY